MTSSILVTTWRQLEDEPDVHPGVYERRVFAGSGFSLFAGLVRPEGQLRLSLVVPASINIAGLDRETRGFRLRCWSTTPGQHVCIALELAGIDYRELFEVMAADVASTILASSSEGAAVQSMRSRLETWELFMQASGPHGLDRRKQIGLFGELTFLRTLLEVGMTPTAALSVWRGPSGANQDFDFGARAVEVKTTAGNSASQVDVSNELQLDESAGQRIFLLHLWLREETGGHLTLPSLIEHLGGFMTGHLRQEFVDRLVLAGYHEVQRTLYENSAYVERSRRYYSVRDDFPRIRRGDLRAGVLTAKYRIELSGLQSYACPEADVLRELAGGAS